MLEVPRWASFRKVLTLGMPARRRGEPEATVGDGGSLGFTAWKMPRAAVWKAVAAAAVSMGLLFATTKGLAAPASLPIRTARIAPSPPPRPLVLSDGANTLAHGSHAGRDASSWSASLPAIEVRNRNTNARAKVRLYNDDGELESLGGPRFHARRGERDWSSQSFGR